MKINNQLLQQVLGVYVDFDFEVDHLALANSDLPNTLTFLDDITFLDQVNSNKNITVVITNSALSKTISTTIKSIIVEVPRYSFYTLLNQVGKLNYKKTPTVIDPSAIIHAAASVSEFNVSIGKNTIVGPNVSILADVIIGNDCVIQPGTVIGSEGFEYKRTSLGVLPVFHDGKVFIGDHVEVGANTCIDKGFSFRHTIIENNVKIDNLVHVAHGVYIGEYSFIIASAMLGGSVKIGKNVWVSPNTSIAPGLTIGDNAFISLGAVVTKNVEPGQQVTGNFAVPHEKFLANFKKSLRTE